MEKGYQKLAIVKDLSVLFLWGGGGPQFSQMATINMYLLWSKAYYP